MATELNTIEKINLIMSRLGMDKTTLAMRWGISRQNLANKFNRGDLRESDLHGIAAALGCKLKIAFVRNDTGEEI